MKGGLITMSTQELIRGLPHDVSESLLSVNRVPGGFLRLSGHIKIHRWLKEFINGTYQFEPMQQYSFKEECVRVFGYADKFFTHLLLQLIKPTFKHIFSPYCFHLKGPSGVKSAIKVIEAALRSGEYSYAIRADIKSYYASIVHSILIQKVNQHFDDPRVRHYFQAIITIAVDAGGHVFLPTIGIPRRGSLSPFFGALYLSSLDNHFRHDNSQSIKNNMVYVRYMDDIVILTKTKKQFQQARKILFKELNVLKLKLAPSKTWMGKITHGFHFLGVEFEVSVTIHPRSCARALAKVEALRQDAVHPATIQRYLSRWATWWSLTVKPVRYIDCLLAWMGQGLVFSSQPKPLDIIR